MGEINLGRLGQLIPLLVNVLSFFVVVTCNEVKLHVVYVLSLSFNAATWSAMFVFPVLCCLCRRCFSLQMVLF